MAENSQKKKRRGPGRPFQPGQTGNPGGRPKSIKDVERMLDSEHRNVEKMRETFELVRRVSHGVDEPVYYKGEVCGHVRKYDSAWMQMYLDRVLGPVRDVEIDLTDAPDEVVRWWAENGPHATN